MRPIFIEKIIPEDSDQQRLDQALAALCPEYSRSQIQQWIRHGAVQVNNVPEQKPRTKVKSGQHVSVRAQIAPQASWQAQQIPLTLVYEDEDILVIDKPAGLVVHPGAGHPQQTLVNALLYYDPNLAAVPRAGLVHRLDKATSGLLVVARHLTAHHHLVKAMQQRDIKREYEAIAEGLLKAAGTIKTSIGRHPRQRTKMSVLAAGKPAVTHYRVMQRFRAHTHVRVQLETGRTHQIRVHFAHIRHPLTGDPDYGSKSPVSTAFSPALRGFLQGFHRQALHAVQLTLSHPRTGEMFSWQSALPADMQLLLQYLQEDYQQH